MNGLSYWLFCWKVHWKRAFDLVEYNHYLEYPLVFKELKLGTGIRLLDVGSGKYGMFPFYVATHTKTAVTATEYDPDAVEEQQRVAKRLRIPKEKVAIKAADVTKLPFASSFFDRVSCISTLDHIDGNGDVQSAREIGRVLKKGGTAVIAVVYNPLKDGEKAYLYARDSRFYRGSHTLYGRHSDSDKVFFGRTYNEKLLHERIIKPSGLKLVRQYFYSEPGFPMARLMFDNNSGVCNFFIKYFLSLFTPLLSALFFRQIHPSGYQLSDWMGAGTIVVLQKA